MNYSLEKETIIKSLGKSISPIFSPIGIEKNNWEASVALITGIVDKEVIIGTLNTLYKSEDIIGKKQNYIFHLFELETDIKNDSIKTKIFNKFNSNKSAFSYLLFILLYFPCISVLAVIYKELNKNVMYIGGGLQLYFGVKGNRWIRHPVISKMINNKWCSVKEEDRPKSLSKNPRLCENSCYW